MAKIVGEKIRPKRPLRKSYVFPIFLKIVTVSLFFSLLSLFLYIATFTTPRSFVFEQMVYIGIILFGISLFAAGSIVEPIERLKEGFSRLSKGEDVYIEVKSGDELEDLADSFNKMVQELKIQRERIKKSEEKYRVLVEDINDWVFEMDKDLRITYSSSRSKEMIGKSPEEILGKSLLNFVGLDDLSVKERFENLKTAEQIRFDVSIRGDGGKIIEIGGRPFFDEKGEIKGFRCVARDITLRKKAEEEAAYLVSILEHSIDAIVSLDLDTKIVSWNKGAELMFGYKAEEMIGKPLSVLIPPERHAECAENFRRVVQEGYVRDIEASRISKSGKIVIVDQTVTGIHDSRGELIGYVAIMRDITERKRSQQDLKMAYAELERKTRELVESQRELEYLANIVENSSDAIYSITMDGKIVSWNKTAEKLFGWRKEEIIGETVEILIPEELKEEVKSIRERIEREENITYETRRVDRFSRVIDVEVTAIPVFDHEGRLMRISFISRDISGRMKVEKELIRRISRFNVEKGKVYLVEGSAELCDEVMNDLVKCGFSGFIFTRRHEDEIGCDAITYYISERNGSNLVPPDLNDLKEKILKLPGWNNAVLIDLDYLIIKNGFSKVLEFVHDLKDVFYLFRKGIVILNVDPGIISEREARLIKRECEPLKTKTVDLPFEIYELARYVYIENRVGNKPSIKKIMDRFKIARNTAKKRINYLVSRGLLRVEKDGRIKLLELTDNGKDYFSSQKIESFP
jgi:PAS domain S-box-containing protein